jgi:tetratricopeptide (TPR) repeat protein
MKRSRGVIIVAVCLLTSTSAIASEQSKRLSARGLVEFHAERYAKALEYFEQAVGADGADPYALYYRGVTRGRLGDYTGAIADLRAAIGIDKEIKQAYLELGVALVQTGQYREAIPYLEQAQRVKDTEAQASFFLGLAQLHVDETEAARTNFERAATRDATLNLAARYYEGVADYRGGSWSQATQNFSYVTTTSPNSEMGREAAAFLERMRQGHGARYEAYGAVGFQYDSNVVLEPSGQPIKGLEGPGDGRAIIDVGATYVPWRNEYALLSVGYEFFQSLHFSLTDFNLQDHRPNIAVAVDAGPVQFGLLTRYDYYLLDTDSFLEEVTGVPWLAIPEADVGRTEFHYRQRWREFRNNARINGQPQDFEIRDAVNYAPGMRQFVYFNPSGSYVVAGYQFDRDNPSHSDDPLSDAFGYDGQQVEAGFGWAFTPEIMTESLYTYRNEHYRASSAQQFAPIGNRRTDEEHRADVALHVQLNTYLQLDTYLAVTAAYFGTINNSNKTLFDYDRHVGSLALEVRF